MLIGGGDISNTSLPLAHFFNVCSHSRSFPLRTDWRSLTAQSTGSHRGIGAKIKGTGLR